MSQPGLPVVIVFSAEDQAWIRHSAIAVPGLKDGHAVMPAQGDTLFG